MKKLQLILLGVIGLASQLSYANYTVPMTMVDGKGAGKALGDIHIEAAQCGVLLKPNLHGLSPGIHGFHVHEKPSCADRAMAAGAHLDPTATGKHNGPYVADSHLGDLPVLIVDKKGRATLPVLVPRFTLDSLKNHALMIHAGEDNYSDRPQKLGGGGDRIACGIIK